jgi:hypothetical protein
VLGKVDGTKSVCDGILRGHTDGREYVPLAESSQIPLVGLFTGAQTLYTPLRRWVINVRASYFDETREQVNGLWKTLPYRKIAVIYPDNAFGGADCRGSKRPSRPPRESPWQWLPMCGSQTIALPRSIK